MKRIIKEIFSLIESIAEIRDIPAHLAEYEYCSSI